MPLSVCCAERKEIDFKTITIVSLGACLRNEPSSYSFSIYAIV